VIYIVLIQIDICIFIFINVRFERQPIDTYMKKFLYDSFDFAFCI